MISQYFIGVPTLRALFDSEHHVVGVGSSHATFSSRPMVILNSGC